MQDEVSQYDAEVAVIGSILINSNSYFRVRKYISENSFRTELTRSIFHAASELAKDGMEIDPISIKARLETEGVKIDNDTLFQYMEMTPTAANDEMYAQIMQEKYKRYRLQRVGELLQTSEDETPELLTAALNELDEIQQTNAGGNTVSSESAFNLLYKDINDRASGKRTYVPTGFKRLDNVLGGGFLNGGLYIIAARPGMGKTSFAIYVADKIAFANGRNRDSPILFVTLEMSVEQITAKRVANRSRVPYKDIMMGNPTEEQHTNMAKAMRWIVETPFMTNKKQSATIADIELMAREIKGLKCIFIDYLAQILPPKGKYEKGGQRYDMITEISGDLKRLAMRLNVPIVCLSQLSRATETRSEKRPQLSDLRESGAIEQDADAVMFLYRDAYYNKEKRPDSPELPETIEVDIAKNRHAECGMVNFNAWLAYNRFSESENTEAGDDAEWAN